MHNYSDKEIQSLREGGRRLAWLVDMLGHELQVGMTVSDIESHARQLINTIGATSATLGYKPRDARTAFPSVICVSVNEEVVHGIAHGNDRVLEDDDLVSLDVVIIYERVYVDICRTYVVGEATEASHEMISASKQVTAMAIVAAVVGNTTNDIGRAAETTAHKLGYEVVRDLGGHGVGKEIHMSPFIPNFAGSGYSNKIQEGMVLAIEPIITTGDGRVHIMSDDWTFRTNDRERTAQHEETVLVTDKGPEILTLLTNIDYGTNTA